MAEKRYKVIVDKYVGKHRVYKKDAIIFESEIIGGEEGKKLALEGQKDQTRKYASDGKVKDPKTNQMVDAPARKLKDVPPKLKLTTEKSEK